MSTPGCAPGPTRQRLGRGDDPLHQSVVDTVDGDHPAGPGARLAAEPERALDDQRGGAVEVGSLGDHDRVLAAHLQLDPALRADLSVNQPTHLCGSGERHRRHAIIRGHRGSGRTVTLDQGDRVRRQPARQQCLDQALPHQRRELGRFEQHGIARGERRPEFARRDVEREVPRRDRADDADRLAQRVHQVWAVRRDSVTPVDAGRFAGVEAQVGRRTADLHGGLGDGLALLADELGDQLVGPSIPDVPRRIPGSRHGARGTSPPMRARPFRARRPLLRHRRGRRRGRCRSGRWGRRGCAASKVRPDTAGTQDPSTKLAPSIIAAPPPPCRRDPTGRCSRRPARRCRRSRPSSSRVAITSSPLSIVNAPRHSAAVEVEGGEVAGSSRSPRITTSPVAEAVPDELDVAAVLIRPEPVRFVGDRVATEHRVRDGRALLVGVVEMLHPHMPPGTVGVPARHVTGGDTRSGSTYAPVRRRRCRRPRAAPKRPRPPRWG